MNIYVIKDSTPSVKMYDRYSSLSVTAYLPVNIYGDVDFGRNINIGAFTEICGHVVIGDNVRIGSQCFIPEGVEIGDDVFVGPAVKFTNDKYPPSDKKKWKKTIVEKGAAIGAGCVIVCGVTIGEGSTIGAGSIVTKDVIAGTIVCGNPAEDILKRQFKDVKKKKGGK